MTMVGAAIAIVVIMIGCGEGDDSTSASVGWRIGRDLLIDQG